MPGKREKVVVAMSGGVDSSVVACLLVEQGYDVVGLFMRSGVKEPESTPESPRESCNTETIVDCAAPRGLKPAAREDSVASAGETKRTAGTKSSEDDSIPKQHDCKPNVARDRHRGCCSASDAADARFVAGQLGIPFYVLNFEKEFDSLIDYFADEYANGRTPNPCVVCNDRLKFGRIVDYADAVGAGRIATGHYAQIDTTGDRPTLRRGVDRKKDQSYVLFGLDRSILCRLMFPVGSLMKDEVRRIAKRFNLPNRNKPDSVEICFVPDQDYARVVKQRRPDAFVAGEVVDQEGQVVGHHQGIGHYTIGQRRGLGIAAGKPIYVTQLDVANQRVTIGGSDALLSRELVANRINFLTDVAPSPFRAHVQIRYLHQAAPATVELSGEDEIRVVFDSPQRAVTPGQAVVIYDEHDGVIGGGWIQRTSAHPAGEPNTISAVRVQSAR